MACETGVDESVTTCVQLYHCSDVLLSDLVHALFLR